MRVIWMAAIAIVLTGCVSARPYNADAIPNASAMLKAQNEQCVSNLNARQYKTMLEFTECVAIAKVNFTKAIDLKDDTVLKAWVARMGTLARDFDTGHIDINGYIARAGQINADFANDLSEKYRLNAQAREDAANRMMAFGQALSNASRALAASTPPPPAPIQHPLMCQSFQVGFVTQTNCQ